MINVAFNTSAEHSKYMLVVLESIFAHNPPNQIHTYVLHQDISEKLQNEITESIVCRGSMISFIYVDPEVVLGLKSFKGNHYEPYFKMFLHKFLPPEEEKVLYLDTDVLVRCSLEPLYNMDLEDKYISAAYEDIAFRKIYLEKDTKFKYDATQKRNKINTGLVLLNLSKFRKNNIELKDYLEVCGRFPDYMYDQGIFTQMFSVDQDQTVYLLPVDYNYWVSAERTTYVEYEAKYHIKPTAKIIQFITSSKPWNKYTDRIEEKYYYEWWNYAKNTRYYSEILENALKYSSLNNNGLSLQTLKYTFDLNKLLFTSGNKELIEGLLSTNRKYSKNNEIYSSINLAQNYTRSNEYSQKDYLSAIRAITPIANLGYELANIYLIDYLWGQNTKDSLENAFFIAEELSKLGNGEAMERLGRAYRDGKGVPQDLEKAAYWMRKAVEKQVDWAYGELFDILWRINTPESIKEMIAHVDKYANAGRATMMGRYGRAYRDGKGVPQDLEKAAYWMRKAVEKQVDWAYGELFDILWRINTPCSLLEAYQVVNIKSDTNGQCMERLGRAYRDGKGVPQDLEKAAYWMRKAVEKQVDWAYGELFDILWRINTPESIKEMIAHVDKYANAGRATMMGRYGRAYRDGKGVPQDLEKAAYWMKCSAEKGVEWAQVELNELQSYLPLWRYLTRSYVSTSNESNTLKDKLIVSPKCAEQYLLENSSSDSLKRELSILYDESHRDALSSVINQLPFEIKKTIIKNIPSPDNYMKLIQSAGIKILTEFNIICEKLGIYYCLTCGSLLGAVRHSGYVPWDDDIDIFMLREDVIKLQDYLTNDQTYQVRYFYQLVNAWRYAKFELKGTQLFIDIFILDKINTDSFEDYVKVRENELKKKNSEIKEIKNKLSRNYPFQFSLDFMNDPASVKDKLLIDSIFDKHLATEGDGKESWYVVGTDGVIGFLKIIGIKDEDMSPLKVVPFEDIQSYVPNNSEIILEQLYGEFNNLPKDYHRHYGLNLKFAKNLIDYLGLDVRTIEKIDRKQ